MKKITFLMLAVTLVLASTAEAAGEVEFSHDKTDYMMNIDFVDSGINTYPYKQYSHVYYVMLKKGYFSDFHKSFKEVYEDSNIPYPEEIAKALEEIRKALEEKGRSDEDVYTPIVEQRVLPFFKHTLGSETIKSVSVYGVHCEAIATKETGRGAFRCTDIPTFTDLDSRYELINFIIDNFNRLDRHVRFYAADPAIDPSLYFSLREMLERGLAADMDGNGIPDPFEALPVSGGCLGDRDCDYVTDAMDQCPDVAGDLAQAGCPPTNAATTITRGFDEGGTCSLTSSASANPASFLLITAALLALVRRLKKVI